RAICRKASRQRAGARKGRRPSRISISAKAVSNDVPMVQGLRSSAGPRRSVPPSAAAPFATMASGPSVAPRRTRILQVPEEVGARIEHQHVALAGEGVPVGIQAAVEGIELRILLEGLGVEDRKSVGLGEACG